MAQSSRWTPSSGQTSSLQSVRRGRPCWRQSLPMTVRLRLVVSRCERHTGTGERDGQGRPRVILPWAHYRKFDTASRSAYHTHSKILYIFKSKTFLETHD